MSSINSSAHAIYHSVGDHSFGGHCGDVKVDVYGGNVPDALAYPQWANTGQVLLKVHNLVDKLQMVLLRVTGESSNENKLYFHLERVHVKDEAEHLENFIFESKDIFTDCEGTEDINLCLLNDAKFILNRKSSRLEDFDDAHGRGKCLYLEPKSQGPQYYLLRMTQGITVGMLGQKEKKFTLRNRCSETYFNVHDVTKSLTVIKKKQMTVKDIGFECRKAFVAGDKHPRGFELGIYGYTGQNLKHVTTSDFQQVLFTSKEFHVGRLKLGIVKGFKTTKQTPEEIVSVLEKKSDEEKKNIFFYEIDSEVTDKLRKVYLTMLDIFYFILLSGDSETIWGDKWLNIINTDLEKEGKTKTRNRDRKKFNELKKTYNLESYAQSNNFICLKNFVLKQYHQNYLQFRHWKQIRSRFFFKDELNFRAIQSKLNKKQTNGKILDYNVPYLLKALCLRLPYYIFDGENVNLFNFFLYDIGKLKDEERSNLSLPPILISSRPRGNSLELFDKSIVPNERKTEKKLTPEMQYDIFTFDSPKKDDEEELGDSQEETEVSPESYPFLGYVAETWQTNQELHNVALDDGGRIDYQFDFDNDPIFNNARKRRHDEVTLTALHQSKRPRTSSLAVVKYNISRVREGGNNLDVNSFEDDEDELGSETEFNVAV